MPSRRPFDDRRAGMAAVVIGVDPAKRSNTIEVIDAVETVLVTARFDNTNVGLPPDAGAGAGGGRIGSGRSRARPGSGCTWRSGWSPTGNGCWMCRRSCRPGSGRSTPGMAARTTRPTRTRSRWSGCGPRGCAQVVPDDQMVALRLLSDRRRDLVRSRTQAVNRLHQVLMELIPAGAPQESDRGRGQGSCWPRSAPATSPGRPAASSRST